MPPTSETLVPRADTQTTCSRARGAGFRGRDDEKFTHLTGATDQQLAMSDLRWRKRWRKRWRQAVAMAVAVAMAKAVVVATGDSGGDSGGDSDSGGGCDGGCDGGGDLRWRSCSQVCDIRPLSNHSVF
jgi:hypothetical protein